MKIILYSLLLAESALAFRVSKVTPKEIRVKEGHPFKVILTTDNWYEVSKSLFPTPASTQVIIFLVKAKNYCIILNLFNFHSQASSHQTDNFSFP